MPERLGSGESKLETIISYLLIVGVVVSLVLETTGIIMFYHSHGNLSIALNDMDLFIEGQNFFSFLLALLSGKHSGSSAVQVMTLGLVTLILTPYARVIASALYFLWRRDVRYVVITLFVLTVLTVSLLLH